MAAAAVVARIMTPRMLDLPRAETLKDPKTRLQEVLQARGLALPTYTLTAATGDQHEQHFTFACAISVFGVAAVGEGASRRRAEQSAAAKIMHLLPAEIRNAV